MLFAAPLIFICLSLINGVSGIDLTARVIAFGNRVFTIESIRFSNFEETGTIIAAGNVTVIDPTRDGLLKQDNCVDEVNIGEAILFDNAEVRFCYEGGPTMLAGGEDTVILQVFPEDGTQGEILTITFLGSDPLIPVSQDDRGVRMIEDEQATIEVGSAFAFFDEDVTEIDDFKIRIDTIPPAIDVVLTDSNGDPIEAETILNSDERITFIPFIRFANCAVAGFKELTDCNNFDPSRSDVDDFTFSIIFGEDDITLGPFDFFYLVQLQTATLNIPNETIAVPINDEFNGVVSFNVNNDVLLIDPDTDEVNTRLEVRFDVVRGDMRINTASRGFTGVGETVDNSCSIFSLDCSVELRDEGEGLNNFLENDFLFFEFNVNEIQNCIVDVTLNEGEEIRRLSFVSVLLDEDPIINDPYDYYDPFDYFPRDDNSISPAAVGVLSGVGAFMGLTLLAVLIFFVVRSVRGKPSSTVQPEENNDPEIPEARRENEIVVEQVYETPGELKVAQEA